jgi:hypothetical protein
MGLNFEFFFNAEGASVIALLSGDCDESAIRTALESTPYFEAITESSAARLILDLSKVPATACPSSLMSWLRDDLASKLLELGVQRVVGVIPDGVDAEDATRAVQNNDLEIRFFQADQIKEASSWVVANALPFDFGFEFVENFGLVVVLQGEPEDHLFSTALSNDALIAAILEHQCRTILLDFREFKNLRPDHYDWLHDELLPSWGMFGVRGVAVATWEHSEFNPMLEVQVGDVRIAYFRSNSTPDEISVWLENARGVLLP